MHQRSGRTTFQLHQGVTPIKLPRAKSRFARGELFLRKERATRQKSQIAAASGSYASVHLQGPQIHRDETRLNGKFV